MSWLIITFTFGNRVASSISLDCTRKQKIPVEANVFFVAFLERMLENKDLLVVNYFLLFLVSQKVTSFLLNIYILRFFFEAFSASKIPKVT